MEKIIAENIVWIIILILLLFTIIKQQMKMKRYKGSFHTLEYLLEEKIIKDDTEIIIHKYSKGPSVDGILLYLLNFEELKTGKKFLVIEDEEKDYDFKYGVIKYEDGGISIRESELNREIP